MSQREAAERCDATSAVNPGSTLLGPFLGPHLDNATVKTLRCRAEKGHDGKHWSTVCPFPGFADQVVSWTATVEEAE